MPDGAAADTMRVLGAFVRDVGFPAFIALYLLVKVNPALERLTKVIHELQVLVQLAAGLTRRGGDPKP